MHCPAGRNMLLKDMVVLHHNIFIDVFTTLCIEIVFWTILKTYKSFE